MDGRHGVHRAHRAGAAEPVERVEVRARGGHRDGRQVEPVGGGEQLDAGVAEGVHGEDVAGAGEDAQDAVQCLLRPAGEQHVLRCRVDSAVQQVGGHGGPVVPVAARRVLAQQCLGVARGSQCPQRLPEQVALVGGERLVEGQVRHPGYRECARGLDAVVAGAHPDEGAAAPLTHHQPGGGQFGVHPGGGGECDPPFAGERAVGRQPGARGEGAGADRRRVLVDDGLVGRGSHGSPAVLAVPAVLAFPRRFWCAGVYPGQ